MADLYGQTVPLNEVPPATRIYAPEAYREVRAASIVPVAHIELLHLARSFPLVWRMSDGRPQMVVIRSFLANTQIVNRAGELPLILRAFPFCSGRRGNEPGSVFFNSGMADNPTDAGAPIILPDGKLGPGSEQRLRALALFWGAHEETSKFSSSLEEEGLLAPWDLPFSEADGRFIAEPLFALRRDLPPPVLRKLSFKFGPVSFYMLSGHRLSLFRAAAMIDAAKKHCSE